MIYGSVCSGIESATVAWHSLGWQPAWFSEIEPFPCKILQHYYPNVPNLGNMLLLHLNPIFNGSAIDVLVGGTPCFIAGTLVMTDKGMIPIEKIKIGDKVLTHKGRWRSVLNIGSKKAHTQLVKGQGAEIITTPNHEFYVRGIDEKWDNSIRNLIKTPQSLRWESADKIQGLRWSIPCKVEKISYPKIIAYGNERGYNHGITPELGYIIGRWLGDGWCRISKRRSYILICTNKIDSIDDQLKNAGLYYSKFNERTTIRYQITNSALSKWLYENFGEKANGKYIPGWVLSLPKNVRKQIFAGYIDSDGSVTKNGCKSTSISKALSYSMGVLAASIGYTYSICKTSSNRKCIIEGRHVNESDNWLVSYYKQPRSAFFKDGYMHGLVRISKPTNKIETVYDLEVEEDHSYTANGVAVHNCQGFSNAGLRGGLDDERSKLSLEFCRILSTKQPAWFVWENVPGVFSTNEGKDLATIIAAFKECGYSVAWRVLDAQYFGVPQRRRRVFVVGYLGNDWRPPAAVLFEPGSLSGNIEKGGKTGKGVAGTLDARTNGGGFPGSDGAMNGHVIPCWWDGGQVSQTLDRVLSKGQTMPEKGRFPAVLVPKSSDLTVFSIMPQNSGKDYKAREVSVTQPIVTNRNQSGNQGGDYIVNRVGIRRLTPLECERLMGFPDGYTGIPGASDSRRYQAIGNSMAVPVMHWLGRRVDMADKMIKQRYGGVPGKSV